MKLKGKFINRKKGSGLKSEIDQPDEDVKKITKSVINEIKTDPVNNKSIKQDKINKIKNIVLTKDVDGNKKSIERLNKFINFTIH
jgi:molybdate-binding protein